MNRVFILLSVVIVIVGCSETPEQRTQRERRISDLYACDMSRVDFDGHLWVVMNGGGADPFAHHPDCPCGKLEKP